MIDYKNIWLKWLAFLNEDSTFRQQILSSLHIEVSKGFDVLTRMAVEECETFFDQLFFEKIKIDLERSFSFSAWRGYTLLLIREGIDPIKENLLGRTQTNELGELWMREYHKDKHKSLLLEIDPILSLFLEKKSQESMNFLLYSYEDLQIKSFKEVQQLETFHNWVTHEGFIIGLLEKKLYS